MRNHVQLVAGNNPYEQRRRLVRLMEMARKTAGFNIGRSVRAREVSKILPDGVETKVTVLFVRTGKESILEGIENWLLCKQDRQLGKKIFESAFPEWPSSGEITFFQSLLGQDRVALKTLEDKIPQHEKAGVALRLAWYEAAAASRAILGSDPILAFLPNTWRTGDGADLYVRSCLGLSARCRKKKADNLLDAFIALIKALHHADYKLQTVQVRQHLVERARRFCKAWSSRKQRNPERHQHAVMTGNLHVLDKLVTCFEKSFPE